MNPSEFVEEFGLCAREELPEAARKLLDADPELSAGVEAQRDVASLLGLKRYETADPAMVARVRARVLERIERGELPAEESNVVAIPLFRWGLPALAAALVAVFGVSALLRGPTDVSASGPAVVTSEPTQPVMEVIHLDAFTSIPTSDEGVSPALMAEMRETARAAEMALRGTRTNEQDSTRFLLPAMQEVQRPLPALPQIDSSLP